MSTNLNRWMNEVNRINNAKYDIANAIRNKGVNLSASVKFDDYPSYINKINAYDLSRSILCYKGTELVFFVSSSNGDMSEIFENTTINIDQIQVGNNVTNMYAAYDNCRNLTGSPVCGEKVTNMAFAYHNCSNLTGSPVCGNNVTNMYAAYDNCRNLTGSPVCGNKVTHMRAAYTNCTNLSGNGYFYSNRLYNIYNCFRGKNNSKRLNLYVPSTGYNTSYNTLAQCLTNNTRSMVGASITWTDAMTTYGCYYNTTYNIYIYPVSNVAAARAANKD